MAGIEVSLITTIAQAVLKFGKWVCSQIQEMTESEECCQRLKKHATTLNIFAKDLEELGSTIKSIPTSCQETIDKVNYNIAECRKILETHNSRGRMKKVLNARSHKKELENVEIKLREMCDYLKLMYTVLSGKKTEEKVEECHEEVKTLVKNIGGDPSDGLFLPHSKNLKSRPVVVDQPMVTLDDEGDLMVVKWRDTKNPRGTVDKYEITYDVEKSKTTFTTPEECAFSKDSSRFFFKMNPSKEKNFTVKVRGLNGMGPGAWSVPSTFKYKRQLRAKHDSITYMITSPLNVRVSGKRTTTTLKVKWDEPATIERGVCFYGYNVEMSQDKKPRVWDDFIVVEEKHATFTDLKSNTSYVFRVQAINSNWEVGEWSDEIEAKTKLPILVQACKVTAVVTGAAVGGTIVGPVIGAVGGGSLAGELAEEAGENKSKGKKKAATISAGTGGAILGGLLGTVGAPVMGIVAAVKAYRAVADSDVSSEDSDDEA